MFIRTVPDVTQTSRPYRHVPLQKHLEYTSLFNYINGSFYIREQYPRSYPGSFMYDDLTRYLRHGEGAYSMSTTIDNVVHKFAISSNSLWWAAGPYNMQPLALICLKPESHKVLKIVANLRDTNLYGVYNEHCFLILDNVLKTKRFRRLHPRLVKWFEEHSSMEIVYKDMKTEVYEPINFQFSSLAAMEEQEKKDLEFIRQTINLV